VDSGVTSAKTVLIKAEEAEQVCNSYRKMVPCDYRRGSLLQCASLVSILIV